MKIINLLYQKYFLSLIICTVSSLTIFFIFSLIGNLNEKYSFLTIIKTSLLNALQILIYVPGFVYLLSIILLTVFLKSKNEIIIIKSYFSIKRLILFILPIVLIFTFFEINKKDLALIIENTKLNLIKSNDKLKFKININEDENYKTFLIFKNFNEKNLKDAEYHSYYISENKIKLAEFSNSFIVLNNKIFAKKYTKYEYNLIEDFIDIKKIDIDFLKLLKQNSLIENISDKKKLLFNIKSINLILFFTLFFIYTFLFFFNKKFTSIKQSLKIPITISLIILLYSFFVFNNSLSFYKQEFEIIASLIMFMFFVKEYLYE